VTIRTKPSSASTAGPTLFGPQASRLSTPKRDSETCPNAASSAAKPKSASEEILRAADLLRGVLLRDDAEEDEAGPALLGQVSAEISEIVERLQSLAGSQMIFEGWNS
jgi:hypothetical protein